MNGLPKCDEKKTGKLVALLVKLFAKRSYEVTEDAIEFNWDTTVDPKMSTGQAFVTMKSDEQAKIAAALFNGHALDKKHTISACTFPDFTKIMEMSAAKKDKDEETSFLELKHHQLNTTTDAYAYQYGKNVYANNLQGQTKVLISMTEEERFGDIQKFNSDQSFMWSPKGTYMILIKSDKVEFVGGSDMKPILTINEPKVETIIFSPCERYVMVYSPKNDTPYAVWNFQTHEKIREFEQ